MDASIVVLLTLCVSVCVCSPHSPTAKEQHHASSAHMESLLQQLQTALEERVMQEEEKQVKEDKQQVEEMQWSRVNNRLFCERSLFNITYLSFTNFSFRCCYDSSRRRFCLDHRVPEENFARPCAAEGGSMEGGGGSLCIRSNRSAVPSFLRSLELCMQDDGMGVCSKGVTLPPCDMIGEEETKTETLVAQLARKSSYSSYVEHRARVNSLLQQLQTELEEERTSQEEMEQAQEMQWRRVSNRLYCENGLANLSLLANYSFRCCFDTRQKRLCFDETVTMEGFKFAWPCQSKPEDGCRKNTTPMTPFYLRNVYLCNREATGEKTCYSGTPIEPCNRKRGTGDTAAIRALLAQYSNN